MRTPAIRPLVLWTGLALLTQVPRASAQDPPAADSPYVRLLKSGKLPPDRLGVAISGIGQRGGPGDLAYLFSRAVDPSGFPPPLRAQALGAISDAVSQRKVFPSGGLVDLTRILDEPHPLAEVAQAALRLASVARVEPTAARVRAMAANPRRDPATRGAAIDTLAVLGGPTDRIMIETVAGDTNPVVAGRAIAALARVDVRAAATLANRYITASDPSYDLAPVLSAFVNLRGGAERLAEAIGRQPPPADAAKLALKALHGLGHAEDSVVAALSQAAGVSPETHPLSASEMAALLAAIPTQGDPARGEAVFRRDNLNCTKCHSLGASGGGVGPDLSAVGVSSSLDYLVNSILLPDQAIKEVYETQMILTDDGRIYQGIVAEKDDQRVVLRDAAGQTYTIPASSIEEMKAGGSLMPKGLVNLMTRPEFIDLVRFLSELGRPGPYAVQTTPTVHRWRVLNEATAGELEGREPLPPTDDSRWLPLYARAGGDLPLADAETLARSRRVIVRAEVAATSAGKAEIRLDATDGVTAQFDGEPVSLGAERTGTIDLKVGRHPLTFVVNSPSRKRDVLRVELVKSPGSSAEFTLVVGK